MPRFWRAQRPTLSNWSNPVLLWFSTPLTWGSTGDSIPLSFQLKPLKQPHLGQPLEISLPPDTTTVSIHYATTHKSTTIQWLPPSQTAGKKYPYMFTQCQAIHARSLLPCPDACGVKYTYRATVTVREWATCLLSAVQQQTSSSNSSSRTFVLQLHLISLLWPSESCNDVKCLHDALFGPNPLF